MRSKEQWERELRFWIDCLVEDMANRYGTRVTDEESMEMRMGDIELREGLMEHICQIVRCRKIGERLWQESRIRREHRIVAQVSHRRMSTSFMQ